jgi:hypothetical protein
VVVTLNVYAGLSVPFAQAPLTPFVLPLTRDVTGVTEAAPEYRATAITALLGADASVAVTVPLVAFPWAHHTSTPV